ncbi:MAG: protein-L-isoaspartate(D-aspartate) O-methyltransferase [Chlorobiaceae bacterium]|nr:protein-L-isoaspartate(D-aspartate) O-methyltransferase [Chlorobiaceae bacterium]NTW10858.1 protein-L-isoaspartate(D-aspartate) O-methyltransferase [Chlorobiaceae bacterium]
MKDAEKLRQQRLEMVETLKQYGIDNRKVLDAFLTVERHRFFDGETAAFAYSDCAYPIGFGQTISQPYTVAYMTTLLAERVPSGKVLEIGTGSGYQAAILDALGYEVYTLERIVGLKERACRVFDELGLNISCRLGDGTLGWDEEAPFDGIMVTAAAPKLPGPLLAQLADNGCMVIPLGTYESQQMTVLMKRGENFEKEVFQHFVFVPLVGKEGWDDDVF